MKGPGPSRCFFRSRRRAVGSIIRSSRVKITQEGRFDPSPVKYTGDQSGKTAEFEPAYLSNIFRRSSGGTSKRHPAREPNDARTAAAAVTRRSVSTRARQRLGAGLIFREPAQSGEHRAQRAGLGPHLEKRGRSWHAKGVTFRSLEGGCSRNCSEARVPAAGAAGVRPPAAGASARRRRAP